MNIDSSPERETRPSADGPSRIDLLEKRFFQLQGQLQQLNERLVEQKVRLATVEALRRGELAKELIQVSMLAYSWVLLLDRQQAGEVSND